MCLSLAPVVGDAQDYRKTVIIEPDEPNKPVVTIFTDDRSIKDLSDEIESTKPSQSSPYDSSPLTVKSLMSEDAMDSEETDEGDLSDILEQDEGISWLWWAGIIAAVLVIVGVILYRRRKSRDDINWSKM